jgi:hypothetical protein
MNLAESFKASDLLVKVGCCIAMQCTVPQQCLTLHTAMAHMLHMRCCMVQMYNACSIADRLLRPFRHLRMRCSDRTVIHKLLAGRMCTRSPTASN